MIELDREYFSRQITLFGEERQERLLNAKVAVLGCGGLGCSIGYAVAGAGVGSIDLVDFDRVSKTNIHRQIAFDMSDVARPKCEVLKEKLLSRGEFLNISAYDMRLEEYLAMGHEVDIIIDATDNLPARKLIDEAAKSREKPWVYASVEEWGGQICFFERSKFDTFCINDRKPGGVATPIVMNIAAISANISLRYLAGLDVERDVLYYYGFANGALELKKFNMPKS